MSNSVLEQTKGKIKLTGIVTGISNENSVREGFTKVSEKAYKSLTFFVQTSEHNRVKVELFGMIKDQVIAYSSKARTSKRIDWAKRNDNHGDFKVLGVNLYFEKGADGKNIRVVKAEYDAIDFIKANLKDGDAVRIQGTMEFSQYTDKQGVTKEQTQFAINSITKLDDQLDLASAEFKEESFFEQEIVVLDTMVDEETKKLIVNAKVIKYNGDTANATFVVDGESLPKLAANVAKRFTLGDFIKVYGRIINSVVVTENTETQVEVSDDDDWGGDDEVSKAFDNNFIRDYVSELRITSVESSTYEPKKYKEEDLFSKDEEAYNGDVASDSGDESEDDEDIDELPFD